MSKERKLADLKKKMRLDEVESRVAEELADTDNDYTKDSYLAYYDASLINKGMVRTLKEKFDKKKGGV